MSNEPTEEELARGLELYNSLEDGGKIVITDFFTPIYHGDDESGVSGPGFFVATADGKKYLLVFKSSTMDELVAELGAHFPNPGH